MGQVIGMGRSNCGNDCSVHVSRNSYTAGAAVAVPTIELQQLGMLILSWKSNKAACSIVCCSMC